MCLSIGCVGKSGDRAVEYVWLSDVSGSRAIERMNISGDRLCRESGGSVNEYIRRSVASGGRVVGLSGDRGSGVG